MINKFISDYKNTKTETKNSTIRDAKSKTNDLPKDKVEIDKHRLRLIAQESEEISKDEFSSKYGEEIMEMDKNVVDDLIDFLVKKIMI